MPEFELRSPVLNHALDTQGFHSEILRSLVRLTRLFITCRMEYCIARGMHVWCRDYPRWKLRYRSANNIAVFRFDTFRKLARLIPHALFIARRLKYKIPHRRSSSARIISVFRHLFVTSSAIPRIFKFIQIQINFFFFVINFCNLLQI